LEGCSCPCGSIGLAGDAPGSSFALSIGCTGCCGSTICTCVSLPGFSSAFNESTSCGVKGLPGSFSNISLASENGTGGSAGGFFTTAGFSSITLAAGLTMTGSPPNTLSALGTTWAVWFFDAAVILSCETGLKTLLTGCDWINAWVGTAVTAFTTLTF